MNKAGNAESVTKGSLTTTTSCQTTSIPKGWVDLGEMTIQTISKQRTGAAIQKKDRPDSKTDGQSPMPRASALGIPVNAKATETSVSAIRERALTQKRGALCCHGRDDDHHRRHRDRHHHAAAVPPPLVPLLVLLLLAATIIVMLTAMRTMPMMMMMGREQNRRGSRSARMPAAVRCHDRRRSSGQRYNPGALRWHPADSRFPTKTAFPRASSPKDPP